VEFTDYQIWKAVIVLIAVAIVAFIKGFTGR
jgi:hypothetical protein